MAAAAEPETPADAETDEDAPLAERPQTLIVRLPESLHAEFRAACADEDRSMSAQVRVLIQGFLDAR